MDKNKAVLFLVVVPVRYYSGHTSNGVYAARLAARLDERAEKYCGEQFLSGRVVAFDEGAASDAGKLWAQRAADLQVDSGYVAFACEPVAVVRLAAVDCIAQSVIS